MPERMIRGSTIKHLRIPDEVIDNYKEDSSNRNQMGNRGRGGSSGGGRGGSGQRGGGRGGSAGGRGGFNNNNRGGGGRNHNSNSNSSNSNSTQNISGGTAGVPPAAKQQRR